MKLLGVRRYICWKIYSNSQSEKALVWEAFGGPPLADLTAFSSCTQFYLQLAEGPGNLTRFIPSTQALIQILEYVLKRQS